MANARLNLTFHDYSGEKSLVSGRGVEMTAANFDAQVALQDALVAAIEAVSLGLLVKKAVVATEARPGSGPASSPSAQRELKWLIRMTDDTTGESVSLSVPCADTSLLLPNSDRMDPDSAEFLALKDALEGYHLSIGLSAVTVVDAILVGRNI